MGMGEMVLEAALKVVCVCVCVGYGKSSEQFLNLKRKEVGI